MDEERLSQICSHYRLGTPLSTPERVLGGLMHRMYHVRTTQGEFAVKVLNLDEGHKPDVRSRYQQSERIASAVAATGLPAIAALEADGAFLFDVGPMTVLTYPWIEGQTRPSTAAEPYQAELIGRILGRIHALDLHFPELESPTPTPFADEEWAALVKKAERRNAAWAVDLRMALPDLARWNRALMKAQKALPDRWVVSHADLHQQNVLWSDANTPWLIDWEGAGLQQPAKEAVVSALEWSGFVEGDPNLTSFCAFLEAYRRERLLSTDELKYGIDACFGNWLGWLHFNVRRALGIVTSDPEEQAMGAEQTVGTLTTVRRVEASFPALIQTCHK